MYSCRKGFGKAAPQDDRGWRLRLLLVSVAALATTAFIVHQDCGGDHRASDQDCLEMKAMDQAARSLGLDGFPGYTEACFSLGERLRMTAQPITGPAADLLHEGARRLHRFRLRLVKVCTVILRTVSETATSLYRRVVLGWTKIIRLTSKAVTSVFRRSLDVVVKDVDGKNIADVLPKQTDDPEDSEDSAHLKGASEDEGESQPAHDEDEDEPIVLRKKDLKIFVLNLAKLIGNEVDEESADALVRSIPSRRLSRADEL